SSATVVATAVIAARSPRVGSKRHRCSPFRSGRLPTPPPPAKPRAVRTRDCPSAACAAPSAASSRAFERASDERTLFVAANEPGLQEHIYFATRVGSSAQFSQLTLLANVDSGSGDGTPLLSADGRTLYFYSRRPGGSGDRDLWFARR